jgi:phosphoserine phosphatase RsbU/P
MDAQTETILAEIKRLKILIAEDDPVAAKVLEVMVETLGYEAIVARNGALAWDAFESFNPRIILTDWQMPEMTGIELCKKVRAANKADYTHIIVLTAAFTSKESYKEAMDAGADDFLRKPYDRDELAVRLRVAERIISFHSQVRELRQLIPICSYCKSIRNDKNYWQGIENYVHRHTGSMLTHGICPDCAEKYFKPALKSPPE